MISRTKYDAVIFDLDGVVTKTARVHAATWKKLFDEYSARRAGSGQAFHPFDPDSDYRCYVDGKPRYDGVESFLQSRGIKLPYGNSADGPDQETICGLGNKKNRLFLELLRTLGVEVFRSTVDLIRNLRSKGIKAAIVSSSKNCAEVLEAARIASLFDTKVDGTDSARLNLKGKPSPDIFLQAARQLGVTPARTVVVEDAIAGVQAGRRGQFGCVIGVDRTGHGAILQESGASAVVTDLSEVAISDTSFSLESNSENLPSAIGSLQEIVRRAEGKRIAVFLDYDGTLTPIVARPDQALLADERRNTLRELAKCYPVAIVSGRDLRDVRELVGLEELIYAGSHGFDIAGPADLSLESQRGTRFLAALDSAEQELRQQLAAIDGALVERKKFSVAVHYRQVMAGDMAAVVEAVAQSLTRHPELHKTHGKKVYDLQPRVDWDKGKAVLWLLEKLGLDQPDVLPFYLGDDVTDEDAFKALEATGVGIVVWSAPRQTAARYALQDPDEVEQFLKTLTFSLKRDRP